MSDFDGIELTSEMWAEGLSSLVAHLNDISNWLADHIPPREILEMWIEIAQEMVDSHEPGDDDPNVFMVARARNIARQLLIFAAGMRQGDHALLEKYDVRDNLVIEGDGLEHFLQERP